MRKELKLQQSSELAAPKSRANTRKVGDDGEAFVASYLHDMDGRVVEIHPRTYRTLYIDGVPRQVSSDNDYHTCFDIKAEGPLDMIYAQVKVMPDSTVSSGHIADAKDKVDRAFPFSFPYLRIQVWQVWKEWVSRPGEHRHKEFRFRVWQRMGLANPVRKNGKRHGVWVEVTTMYQQP